MSVSRSILRPVLRQNVIVSRVSIAQFASSSRSQDDTPSKKLKGKKKNVISSCPPGTILHGLSILKGQSDPVAKPEEEYPAWLWNILNTTKTADLADAPRETPKPGRPFDFAKEKMRLRAQNRADIKAANFLKGT